MNTNAKAELMRSRATRWVEEGWRHGNLEIVDELHSPDFIDHDSAGRSSDNEGFKQGIAGLYKAFPDLYASVTNIVVDTDRDTVAVGWSAEGTHKGPYLGAAPSGRKIRFKGIEIIRFRDGKIIERWGEWDGIDLLIQLGVLDLE